MRFILSVSIAAAGSLGMAAATTGLAVAADRTDGPTVKGALAAAVPVSQVVVYDRLAGTTTLVSHDSSGLPGTLPSSRPSISADGSFVAFESQAGLVPGDGNQAADIYLWSRSSDAVRRISVGPGGGDADGASHTPSISGDGGVIAFASTATNLKGSVGLTGATTQIFASQPATGSIVLVSAGRTGPGSALSAEPSVSQDGRVVAFESAAPNLISGDTNGRTDVFLRNIWLGLTIRASLDSKGHQVAGISHRPSISGDGSDVAFDSTFGGFVPGDTNGVRDVFVRDLPAALVVAPNPVDFGSVPLGVPATRAVSVLNVGWRLVLMQASSIGGLNATDFVVAGDGCTGHRLEYGTSCPIAVLDVPLAAGPRAGSLAITDSAPLSPQVVPLRSGVGGPLLRLDPQLGPPGFVATAIGSGFPPGALVTLRWNVGINGSGGPVAVGPNGTFRMAVLVFPNDVVGSRLLIASSAGGTPFADARATFLVTVASGQPPSSGAVRYISPELLSAIVFRR